MLLINLVITLAVIGMILWGVNTYIPMDGKVKQILNFVVVIATVLYVLSAFGVIGATSGVRVVN